MANLYFRIYEKGQSDKTPFLSNFRAVKKFPKPLFDSTKSFEEEIQDETFQSVLTPLENSAGDRIGHIIISTSKRTEHDIQSRVLAYSILALLFGILCLSLIAWWFKRTIVNPLDEIAMASRRVAHGNFADRLTCQHAQREIQETIIQFNHMMSELEKNEQLKQNFISSLTHDLRTPLLAERRALELFSDFQDEIPKQLSSLTKGLISSNAHLLEMVNQLLELYKYEAGKVPTQLKLTTLNTIVETCIANLTPLANAKNIQLINNLTKKLPPLIVDPHQIERIFTNIIGNAIENIPSGCQVEISAQQTTLEQLEIEIKDNGPGIPPDLLPHLFERYANTQGTQKKIGSGLGLAICKMIAEAHQGTIKAEALKPNGTRFILTLPISTEKGSLHGTPGKQPQQTEHQDA